MNNAQRRKETKSFMGVIITRKNKERLLQEWEEEYILSVAKRGNPDALTVEQIEENAKRFALFELKREKKHLKAFLKGQQFYKIYGKVYPVVTPEFVERQNAMNQLAELKIEQEENE